MSAETNKAVVRGWINDVLNGHDIAAIERYYASNCVYHDTDMGDGHGLAAEKQITTTFVDAFPDLHFTLQRILGEGEFVAAQATCSGTNTGSLMGMPPSGKGFEAAFMFIFHLADGKIVEHWSNSNIMPQLQRAGIMPAGAPA